MSMHTRRRTMPSWCYLGLFVAAISVPGCSRTAVPPPTPPVAIEIEEDTSGTSVAVSEGQIEAEENESMGAEAKSVMATFASGCYWCTEAVFQRLEGVENVVSGFMGGEIPNPTYEAVCQGITGHAECIQFEYDPSKVSYEELLEVFWKTHDPTTLNRQGADVGTQYRSAVFFHNEEQRELAEAYKKKLDEAQVFDAPIVTEITEASEFYAAKAMHQNFYNDNPNQGYCSFVIRPKIEKLEAVFADKLKK